MKGVPGQMCQKVVSGPYCRLVDPGCPKIKKRRQGAALVALRPYIIALRIGVKSLGAAPFVHLISTGRVAQPVLFDV
jgi:hypothetical protein